MPTVTLLRRQVSNVAKSVANGQELKHRTSNMSVSSGPDTVTSEEPPELANGVELDGFLLAALNHSTNDRLFLLKLDKEMENFINDKR